ncbi:MAG TPA: glutaredoxin family protein [Burkholderiaceae bacterium]|nr:glutaredoxin family protein [Burkholderiaceae bacterium]
MRRLSPRLRSGLSLLALVLAVTAASEAWQAWSARQVGREVAALARPGDILMIASDTCAYCAQAREWFTAHAVPYRECSIERDAACAERFAALLAPGTPVILVRDRPQVGFSPQRVAEALRRS